MIPTFAVIPSEGREMLRDCISSVRDQVDHIIVVANGTYQGEDLSDVSVIRDESADRNISRWWNIGISLAADHGHQAWNVLVLNDDTIVHSGSVARLGASLRSHDSVLAFPGHVDKTITEPTGDRITGWCFMLRGESGVRADEDFVWWYGDNDLDWRCRSLSSVVMVKDVHVTHRDPNGYTNRMPELSVQAGKDQEAFLSRWGRLPH